MAVIGGTAQSESSTRLLSTLWSWRSSSRLLLDLSHPEPHRLRALMGRPEELFLHEIQPSQKLRPFTLRASKIVCMICNLRRPFLERLQQDIHNLFLFKQFQYPCC